MPSRRHYPWSDSGSRQRPRVHPYGPAAPANGLVAGTGSGRKAPWPASPACPGSTSSAAARPTGRWFAASTRSRSATPGRGRGSRRRRGHRRLRDRPDPARPPGRRARGHHLGVHVPDVRAGRGRGADRRGHLGRRAPDGAPPGRPHGADGAPARPGPRGRRAGGRAVGGRAGHLRPVRLRPREPAVLRGGDPRARRAGRPRGPPPARPDRHARRGQVRGGRGVRRRARRPAGTTGAQRPLVGALHLRPAVRTPRGERAALPGGQRPSGAGAGLRHLHLEGGVAGELGREPDRGAGGAVQRPRRRSAPVAHPVLLRPGRTGDRPAPAGRRPAAAPARRRPPGATGAEGRALRPARRPARGVARPDLRRGVARRGRGRRRAVSVERRSVAAGGRTRTTPRSSGPTSSPTWSSTCASWGRRTSAARRSPSAPPPGCSTRSRRARRPGLGRAMRYEPAPFCPFVF